NLGGDGGVPVIGAIDIGPPFTSLYTGFKPPCLSVFSTSSLNNLSRYLAEGLSEGSVRSISRISPDKTLTGAMFAKTNFIDREFKVSSRESEVTYSPIF